MNGYFPVYICIYFIMDFVRFCWAMWKAGCQGLIYIRMTFRNLIIPLQLRCSQLTHLTPEQSIKSYQYPSRANSKIQREFMAQIITYYTVQVKSSRNKGVVHPCKFNVMLLVHPHNYGQVTMVSQWTGLLTAPAVEEGAPATCLRMDSDHGSPGVPTCIHMTCKNGNTYKHHMICACI